MLPTRDGMTSLSAIGSAGAAQKGAVPFTTTHWSVVLEAQSEESPAAHEALEKLCRVYWRPIYSFVQRQGISPEEAEDLTQGFFADLFERGSLTAVRKEKGRFRSYLLGALKHFLADERRRAMAIKRGKGQRLIPLEELSADDRIEPADPVTAGFHSSTTPAAPKTQPTALTRSIRTPPEEAIQPWAINPS
jgi:DNA-directed RNA polymerase specialized sigma24 family protein